MAHAGTAHKYSKRHIAFEHGSIAAPTQKTPNTLIWIGGLTDGLLSGSYTASLAASLPSSWVLVEVLLSSSYHGWATGSLARDARELGGCVKYFKKLRPGKKVVLMGHSTGCQDIMEYVVGAEAAKRPGVDGAILQGGVSDREAWYSMLKDDQEKQKAADMIKQAKDLIDAGKSKEMMPHEGNMVAEMLGGAVSAYRTYSILAPGGDDDYFSSDLSDDHFAKTFGKFPRTTPVCFLIGSQDEYVPASVDKAALQKRWTRIIREGGGRVDDEHGGIIEGANHGLDGVAEEVVQDLVKRVCGFLNRLGEDNSVWESSASRL